MHMTQVEQQITDAIAKVLLRYFRSGDLVVLTDGVRTDSRDTAYLLLHWAISKEIVDLARYLWDRRHETQMILERVKSELSGVARGRVDAVATLLARLRTGDLSRTISWTASRRADVGVNRLLVWVLKRALDILEGFESVTGPGGAYHERVQLARSLISDASNVSVLSDMFRSLRLTNPPTPQDVAQATRHRRPIYRLAAAAYRKLRQVEDGNQDEITSLLSDSLLGPLEHWRRFELLVALSIGEAIARRLGVPLSLNIIGAGRMDAPLASCDRYAIYWQSQTSYYSAPTPEPSERTARDIFSAFGLHQGGDRPDVVIADTNKGQVIALAEAKFMATDRSSVEAAFREAVVQVVRYSRGYEGDVLAHSVLAVSDLPPGIGTGSPNTTCPFAVDLDGVLSGGLDRWAGETIPEQTAAGAGVA